jgi:hypothetical protein
MKQLISFPRLPEEILWQPCRLHVNATYPVKVPLQSTPPTLLLDLSQLPSEVEYRIVGRDLVLRDVGANLVVDFNPWRPSAI